MIHAVSRISMKLQNLFKELLRFFKLIDASYILIHATNCTSIEKFDSTSLLRIKQFLPTIIPLTE